METQISSSWGNSIKTKLISLQILSCLFFIVLENCKLGRWNITPITSRTADKFGLFFLSLSIFSFCWTTIMFNNKQIFFNKQRNNFLSKAQTFLRILFSVVLRIFSIFRRQSCMLFFCGCSDSFLWVFRKYFDASHWANSPLAWREKENIIQVECRCLFGSEWKEERGTFKSVLNDIQNLKYRNRIHD